MCDLLSSLFDIRVIEMDRFTSMPVDEIMNAANEGDFNRLVSTVLSMTSNFNVGSESSSDETESDNDDSDEETDIRQKISHSPSGKKVEVGSSAGSIGVESEASEFSKQTCTNSTKERVVNTKNVPKIYVNRNLTSDATSQAVHKMLNRFCSTSISPSAIEEIEDDLSFYEKVSMVFLLYDSDDLALQRLITALRSYSTASISHCRLLSDWALHESSENWSDKFLEALAIIGNYACIRKLGHGLKDVEIRFLPKNRDTSLFVDLMRKALYVMCESLSYQQLQRLQMLVEKDMEYEGRMPDRYDVELMEMNILHWMSQRYLKVGIVGSGDISIKNLTKHLKVMEEFNLVDYMETIAKRCHRRPSDPFPDQSDQLSVRSAFSNSPASSHSVVTCQEGGSVPLQQFTYNIDPHNVGVCVIINQRKFYKEPNPKLQHLVHEEYLEPRMGTDVDRDRLCEVFLGYGFFVRIWEDLTHIQLVQAIKEAADNLVKKEHTCFVLCILSHGRRNAVYGVNSIAVDVDEIEKLLHGKYCPNLLGKPKVVIVQACQGLVKQSAVSYDLGTDGASCSRSNPEVSDTLTFWSTVPGYAAFRDRITGSWFIKAIWEEMLRKTSVGLDVMSIFVNVNLLVCSKRAPIDGELKAMTPQFITSFRGKLVLPYIAEAVKSIAKRIFERYLFDQLLEEYIERLVKTKREKQNALKI